MEKDLANEILYAIHAVDRKVDAVTIRLDDHDEDFSEMRAELRDMRRTIHGTSKPPPPPANGVANGSSSLVSMATRGSAASFDVEELRGELLAVRAELAKQSNKMGIGKRGLAWLWSSEGKATIIRLATLAGVGYAAFQAAAGRH